MHVQRESGFPQKDFGNSFSLLVTLIEVLCLCWEGRQRVEALRYLGFGNLDVQQQFKLCVLMLPNNTNGNVSKTMDLEFPKVVAFILPSIVAPTQKEPDTKLHEFGVYGTPSGQFCVCGARHGRTHFCLLSSQ